MELKPDFLEKWSARIREEREITQHLLKKYDDCIACLDRIDDGIDELMNIILSAKGITNDNTKN